LSVELSPVWDVRPAPWPDRGTWADPSGDPSESLTKVRDPTSSVTASSIIHARNYRLKFEVQEGAFGRSERLMVKPGNLWAKSLNC